MPQKRGSDGRAPGTSINFEDGSSRVMTPTDVMGGFGPPPRAAGEMHPAVMQLLMLLDAGAANRGQTNGNDLRGLFGGGPPPVGIQYANHDPGPEAAPTPTDEAQPFTSWLRRRGHYR